MTEERLDIYNANREKTGKIIARKKADSLSAEEYRLVVHVCIFNSCGEMLIQQRQSFKTYFPNQWDITAGGAVKAGETSAQTGEREVAEELGIDISLQNRHPSVSLNFSKGFGEVYLIEKSDIDIDKLTLQYEEVKSVRWATKEQIFSMIDTGEFIPYNKGIIEMLFFKRNHTDNFTEDFRHYRNQHLFPITFYDRFTEKQLQDENTVKYAVIIARYQDKFIFCRHKDRNTYELPGGHREHKETIHETATRELREETGATKFTLTPVCGYKVEDYGVLYYAEIFALEEKLCHEIQRIILSEKIPEELTYPHIHPFLLIEAKRRNFIDL